MDPQLSIDSILTAARLLENTQLLSTSLSLGHISLPSAVPLSMTMPVSTVPTEAIYSDVGQAEFRDLISGKMRVERKCPASTSAQPYCTVSPLRKGSTKHSRAAHNELEKTRRANLRTYLEKLKTLVPAVSDAARNTTLALLTRARDHIKHLDDVNAEAERELQLQRERNAELRAEAERLRESARVDDSRPVSCDLRVSPMLLEYSPSNKPFQSPRAIIIDPVAEGLLPALPVSFPRPSVYPFYDLNPQPASQRPFLPIHLSV